MGSSVIFTVAFRARGALQLLPSWEKKRFIYTIIVHKPENINERSQIVGFRWFNIVGFLMLLFALFLNELVYLNVWYDFNLAVIVPAIAYLGVGLWLSLWGGPRRQEA